MAFFSTSIGIDISDHHVRLAWLNRRGKTEGLFELTLPKGIVVDDIVVKPKALSEQVKKLIAKAGLADADLNAVILIPESRVFSTGFILGKDDINVRDVEEAALAEAQRSIPIPFRLAAVDVVRGAIVPEGVRVSVFAVEEAVRKSCEQAFALDNLTVIAMEANNVALFRLFFEFATRDVRLKGPNDLVMIVDIGSRWINLTLYDKMQTSIFSRSILVNTRSGGSASQADLKRMYGVIEETKRFFEQQGFSVPSIVLAGVTGREAKVCKGCEKIIKDASIRHIGDIIDLPKLTATDIHTFGAAIGGALRAAKPKLFNSTHNFVR